MGDSFEMLNKVLIEKERKKERKCEKMTKVK